MSLEIASLALWLAIVTAPRRDDSRRKVPPGSNAFLLAGSVPEMRGIDVLWQLAAAAPK